MEHVFRARVWCVDDDINTDLILPIDVLQYPRAQRPQHVFRANRPGWSAQVRPGDILVGGRNFGMGSGRPAAQTLKDLGIACVLCETMNGLFLRNCANFALPALQVEGVRAAFEEGEEAEVDFPAGRVTNLTKGRTLQGPPWPRLLLDAWRAGGLVEQLDAEGYLHPAGWAPPPGTSLARA